MKFLITEWRRVGLGMQGKFRLFSNSTGEILEEEQTVTVNWCHRNKDRTKKKRPASFEKQVQKPGKKINRKNSLHNQIEWGD